MQNASRGTIIVKFLLCILFGLQLAIYSEPDATLSKRVGDLKAVDDYPCRIVTSGWLADGDDDIDD